MGELTDDQLAILEASPPAEPPPVDDYDSWFKYEDPTTYSAGVMNSFKMLANVPYSTFKLADAAYETGTDPVGVGKILLKGISGAGEVVAQELGLQDATTENSEVAREIGRFYIDRITNPGRTLVEDPMGALFDIAGIANPAMRMAGIPAKIQPLRQGIAGAGKAANVLARVGREGLALGSGMVSGKARRAYNKVYKGSSEGRGAEIGDYLNERASAMGMVTTFRNAVADLKEARLADYKPKLRKLKEKGSGDRGESVTVGGTAKKPLRAYKPGIDMSADLYTVKKDLVSTLRDEYDVVVRHEDLNSNAVTLNFVNSAIDNPGVEKKIRKLVRKLETWTDYTPYGLDKLKRALDTMRSPNGKKHGVSNAINSKVRGDIRTKLGKIDGYNDMVEPFENSAKFHDQLNQVLSAASNNPETVVNKLTTMMGESAGKEIRLALVESLERRTGVPISEQVAGLELSEWVGKGLFGKGVIWAAVGKFGNVTDNLNWDTVAWMAVVPLTSPRLMGNFFKGMGVSKNAVNNMIRFTQDIHDALPEGAKAGMTMLQAIEHIEQHNSLVNDNGGFIPLAKRKPQVGDQLGDAIPTSTPDFEGVQVQSPSSQDSSAVRVIEGIR